MLNLPIPSLRWPTALLLIAAAACNAPSASTTPTPTNATLNFVTPPGLSELARPITVCLAVTRPGGVSLHNGPGESGAIDGRATFPASTQAAAIVAHYAALLKRHGWVDGTHFTAAGNSLHFYGITALAAGADDAQLGVFGATDGEEVSFRTVAPLAK